MTGFTATSDVWAVGVITIWLLRGRHPWLLGVNPWHPNIGSERDRQTFHEMYDQATTYARQLQDKCALREDYPRPARYSKS